MSRFKALDLHVTAKPDLTPVSDADTAVEEALRRTLGRARPRDAVHGEEMADTGWGPRRWVIDPIDGTKNFVRGVPVWATLIALMINDEVVVGVVSAPALGRRWWASLGGGAYAGKSLMSATPCHVSDVAAIEDASLSYASSRRLGRGRPGPGVRRPAARRAGGPGRTATSGPTCCWPRAASTSPANRSWRCTTWPPASIVVTEAGGRFTDLDGQAGPARRRRLRHQRPAARRGAGAAVAGRARGGSLAGRVPR